MAAILERPAVEEETGLGVKQVFDVQEELALCFFDVVRPVQDLTDFCEWEDYRAELVGDFIFWALGLIWIANRSSSRCRPIVAACWA